MSRQNNDKTSILIVNGSCCMPQMAPLEEQVLRMVEQVIAEEHLDAVVQTMSMSQAYFGGIPRAILVPEMEKSARTGEMGLPVVMVDGKVATRGLPDPATLRAALLGARKAKEVVPGGQ